MDSEEKEKLERSKRRARAGRAAPTLEPLMPEVRTAIKWKAAPPNRPPSFRPEAQIVVVWRYGLPFAQIDGFHIWLATNEGDLAKLCSSLTNKKVSYLGTFLHVESGTPMYETHWGYAISPGVTQEDCEKALETALRGTTSNLHKLVTELRSCWVRDPGRSDHLYGLGANYLNISALQKGGPFWDVTINATNQPPL